jgi:5-hydroxyisourate hydrolase-like protein (transthyretin family)
MKFKILLLSFVFITGCLKSNATGNEPGNPDMKISEVSGSVIDAESKKPLKEVTVTAYLVSKKEKHVITDEFGKFDFDELRSGVYKLVFEKDGYKKVTKEKVTIKNDETFQMRIEMIETEDLDLILSPMYFFDTE